jgi:hypothetical protein
MAAKRHKKNKNEISELVFSMGYPVATDFTTHQ